MTTLSAGAGDLAELMRAFNEVTARLERTHEDLRAEVARLHDELRAANEQLARSQRLAALGEIAAGIAHEVRNPLASIALDARMLREDSSGPATGLAARIERAVRDADAIVNDVLSFAREIVLRPSFEDAAELAARTVEDCARAVGGVPVEVRAERCDVLGDPALLRQALGNVVRNAMEACAGRDEPLVVVEVRPRRARAADGPARPVVAFAVRDTGPGIDASVRARMFNPFFTTRPAGTGLGLAIVHRIVDAHRGRVRVRNNADDPAWGDPRGACVELEIPRDGPGVEGQP